MNPYTGALISVHINEHFYSYFIRIDKTNMEHWNNEYFEHKIDDEIKFIFSYLITLFNPFEHTENSPLTYSENNHHFTIFTNSFIQ